MDQPHDLDAIKSNLAARDIALHQGEHEGRPAFFLQGATFPLKDMIKRQGGRWESTQQRWRLTDLASVAAVLDPNNAPSASFAAPRTKTSGGLAEEATSFEAYGSKHYHGHRERLRQRFMDAGPDALADYELLELLLFFSVWRRDTKPLAKAMLERFGGLGGVLAAEPQRYEELVRGNLPEGAANAGKRDEDLFFTQVLLRAIRSVNDRVL